MKKLVSIILAFVLIFSLAQVPTFAYTSVAETDRYYRNEMAKKVSYGYYVECYDIMVSAIKNHQEEAIFDTTESRLTVDNASWLLDTMLLDHPEIFYLDNKLAFKTLTDEDGNKYVVGMALYYTMTADEVTAANNAIANKTSTIISGIKKGATDFEIELYLHDYLTENVTYTLAGKHIYDMYGALIDGKAVCEGYSEAYKYLLNLCGIKSILITGQVNNSSTGQKEGHQWNLVELGGNYYHVDTTWDDQDENGTWHAYFNVTDSKIQIDHELFVPMVPIPRAEATAENYFVKNKTALTSLTVSGVASLFNNGVAVFSYNGTDDLDWFQNNAIAVADELGIMGYFQIGYMRYSNEIHFIIMAVMPGDVSNDGEIDDKDVSTLRKYLAGWNVQVNVAALDINKDGEVDDKDASYLAKYLAGWSGYSLS